MNPLLLSGALSLGGEVLNNLTSGSAKAVDRSGEASSFAAAMEKAEARAVTPQSAVGRITSMQEVQKALKTNGITPISWRISQAGRLYAVQSDRSSTEISLSAEGKKLVREIYEAASPSSATIAGGGSFNRGHLLELSGTNMIVHTGER